MSVKTIVSFVALLCAVGIVAGADGQCISQTDCEDTHCCSKRIFSTLAYCVERRKLNELCIADEVGHTLTNGVYDITCPCEGSLKCIKEDYMASNGDIYSMGNPRCREPTYAGSKPPVNFADYGNSASANANSEADSD